MGWGGVGREGGGLAERFRIGRNLALSMKWWRKAPRFNTLGAFLGCRVQGLGVQGFGSLEGLLKRDASRVPAEESRRWDSGPNGFRGVCGLGCIEFRACRVERLDQRC